MRTVTIPMIYARSLYKEKNVPRTLSQMHACHQDVHALRLLYKRRRKTLVDACPQSVHALHLPHKKHKTKHTVCLPACHARQLTELSSKRRNTPSVCRPAMPGSIELSSNGTQPQRTQQTIFHGTLRNESSTAAMSASSFARAKMAKPKKSSTPPPSAGRRSVGPAFVSAVSAWPLPLPKFGNSRLDELFILSTRSHLLSLSGKTWWKACKGTLQRSHPPARTCQASFCALRL